MSENSFKISGQAQLGTVAARRPFLRISSIWLCIMLLRQCFLWLLAFQRCHIVPRALAQWSCLLRSFPGKSWIYFLRANLLNQQSDHLVSPAWELEIWTKDDKWPGTPHQTFFLCAQRNFSQILQERHSLLQRLAVRQFPATLELYNHGTRSPSIFLGQAPIQRSMTNSRKKN